MRDDKCSAFLRWALPQLGRSWPGYRKVRRIVCKRLARRLRSLGLADLDGYAQQLATHAEEWQHLDALCGIPISRFYRDRGVFDTLEHVVLPAVAGAVAAQSRTTLDCWSAGCASGEEAYTLAILWVVRLQPRCPQLDMRIVATDLDERLLARARAGRYAASSLKELPEDLLAAGFEPVDGGWRVRDRFRRVEFLRQDLREAMPDGPFDLVLCRNAVLTYYAPAVQLAVMRRIADRLRPGGALVVGIHEWLPDGLASLAPWPGARGVHRRAAG
ncbi:MAG TPA: CheR family methyltransferase [Burkholderiales bacterium]|nr:CheR family methyltransferase [Burkholderiales bacterium]